MGTQIRITFFLLAMSLPAVIAPTRAHAEVEGTSKEYKVKAAFIYNFVQFVEWPPGGVADAPMVIGILGEDPFRGALEEVVEGKSAGQRRLSVKHFARVADLKDVHVLFVPGSEEQQLGAIREKLAGASVLTIGESEDFASAGGIIRFFLEGGKIRFEINLRAAVAAKLKISARLLKLARVLE
jgi:hypothetical protein